MAANKNLEKMSDVVTVSLMQKQGLTVGDNSTGLSNPYKASTIATDAVFVAKTLSYGGDFPTLINLHSWVTHC